MKICPQCHKHTLKAIRSDSEIVGDSLHIIREYQCLTCTYYYNSTEKVKDGAPRHITGYLKKMQKTKFQIVD